MRTRGGTFFIREKSMCCLWMVSFPGKRFFVEEMWKSFSFAIDFLALIIYNWYQKER